MQMIVRGRGLEVDDGLRSHVERRAGAALGRFEPRLDRVSVRLATVDGPMERGVRCAVGLRTAGGSLEVEDGGDDAFEAATRAIDRAGRALARHLERTWAAT